MSTLTENSAGLNEILRTANALPNASGNAWKLLKEVTLTEDVRQFTISDFSVTGEIMIQYEIVAAKANTNNGNLRIYFNNKPGEVYDCGQAIYTGVAIHGYLYRMYYDGWLAPFVYGRRYGDIEFSVQGKSNYANNTTIESVTLFAANEAAILGAGTICKIYGR